jgi:hypothetical protein
MPDFIAVWLPLILAKFRVPRSQPISAPPLKTIFGSEFRPPLADGAGAVADALAAFEVLAEHRVVLEALELVERRQVRVAVGQVDDQADHHLVVFQVIEERATGVLGAMMSSGQPAVCTTRPCWCLAGSISQISFRPMP